jgi:hypothetical protein
MPSFLIATQFLGQWCGTAPAHGVNPEMRERLLAAESALQATYKSLRPNERVDPSTGKGNASFARWSAVMGPHVCWRPQAGHHSAGSAIDINGPTNPYIVTRNGSVPGGEEGAEHLVDMRNRTLAAYDRAMQFMTPPVAAADVSPRRPGESTHSVWTRFKAASDALVGYLSFAIKYQPAEVSRVAIENADGIADEELLTAIAETERHPPEVALPELERYLGAADFQAGHSDWPNDPRAQYLRILRDYEHVRISMVIGSPCAAPERTRNPARGFVNLRSEIVAALCDQGLRWGACDLEIAADGSSANGAMMHFDLADDGGYPEIHSLLRFG